jgi:hypothetical protein
MNFLDNIEYHKTNYELVIFLKKILKKIYMLPLSDKILKKEIKLYCFNKIKDYILKINNEIILESSKKNKNLQLINDLNAKRFYLKRWYQKYIEII